LTALSCGVRLESGLIKCRREGYMKNKTFIFSIILFLFAFIIFISCRQQKTEWKGTIEEVDGVTVVKNPKEPMYGEDVFSLEEELSIGEVKGTEEYMFSRIGLDVDEEGNMYVLETREAKIRVFDKYGNHVLSFGKQGQGPGEMMIPTTTGFQITPRNEIMVYDPPARRFVFFSLDGKYLRIVSSATVMEVLNPVSVTSTGKFIAQTNPPPIYDKGLKIFDADLNAIKIIAMLKAFYKEGEINALRPSFFFVVSPEDFIIWGHSDRYELNILSLEGKLEKKITKNCIPIEVTEDYKERVRELFESRLSSLDGSQMKLAFPKYFPAIGNLTMDDTGRLFVETYEEAKNRTGYHYFDVFSPEGMYIAKIPLKTEQVYNYIWKKSKLYTIEEDEEGFPVVKRYKVTWNLKEGPE